MQILLQNEQDKPFRHSINKTCHNLSFLCPPDCYEAMAAIFLGFSLGSGFGRIAFLGELT
jgi:hypothetical protein